MRFSPRSRPSGRNHSCNVCAPPPTPPAPMAMAGVPSDRGILASVEAQSRRDRMPKCASTARIYLRMGASSASAAAGREPISLRREVTWPPEARWFSVSRARSTACSSAPTSSSIFWLLSERMSILARAACAIAFTPAPPSISPTLMADLGEPATAVSANRATARHSACTGLPTPKSLQLWPPGPLNTASKRRLPNARQVM